MEVIPPTHPNAHTCKASFALSVLDDTGKLWLVMRCACGTVVDHYLLEGS